MHGKTALRVDFIHRVEFGEVSGLRVLIKRGPGTRGQSACQCKRHEFHLWVGKIHLEKKMATHSSILAWKITWTEEPGRLQSMGSQRVGHN